MSGKPAMRKPASKKGIKGIALAKVGDKQVTFVFRDGEHEGEAFKFRNSDFPADFPETVALENGRKYFVSINPNGDELVSVRPISGLFVVKAVDFARNNDEDFLIITSKNTFDSETVSVVAETEIQKGEWAGARIPIYLRLQTGDSQYIQEDDDGNVILVGNLEKSQPFANLYDFWTYAIGDTPVKYDEDIAVLLANILKVILRQKNEFHSLLVKGYSDRLSDVDVVEDMDEVEKVSDDEPEDEKPTSKKPVKSTDKNVDDDDSDPDDEDEGDLRK